MRPIVKVAAPTPRMRSTESPNVRPILRPPTSVMERNVARSWAKDRLRTGRREVGRRPNEPSASPIARPDAKAGPNVRPNAPVWKCHR